MKKYLTCAETAKLVRAALKESFPGVKFSVKSKTYSGGASITVGWINGPTSDQVDGIIKVFEGSYFDGMTDYKGIKYSAINGEEVSFGADFVFTNRKYTAEFLQATLATTAAKYGVANTAEVVDSIYSGAWIKDNSYDRVIGNWTLGDAAMRAAAEFSFDDAAESATVDSVTGLGDDGYGYGCTGRLAVA